MLESTDVVEVIDSPAGNCPHDPACRRSVDGSTSVTEAPLLSQLDTSIPFAPIDSTAPFVTGTEIEATERTVTGATEPKALA